MSLVEKPKPTTEELLTKAKKPAADAMRLHPFYRGKVQTALRARVDGFEDFAVCRLVYPRRGSPLSRYR
jgi:hypothetical protein